MKMNLDNLKIIGNFLGIIFTALTGFLIAKYTYHRNRPLDKFEIAYDNIYYPIQQMLKVNNRALDLQIIAQVDFILKKYHKYVDVTTTISFRKYKEYFEKSYSPRKINSAKKEFENNISNFNTFLRFRLGYLVPNFYKIYMSLPFTDQMIVNLGFGYSAVFLFIGLSMIFKDYDIIQKGFVLILCLILIVLLYSAAMLAVVAVWHFILWIIKGISCITSKFKVNTD